MNDPRVPPTADPLLAAAWSVDEVGDRVAVVAGAQWLVEVREHRTSAREATARRSPDGAESLLVVLAGTHDLGAGGGAWIRRGLRESPFGPGRPVAIFLPPRTPYRIENGEGLVVVITLRQPAVATAGDAANATPPPRPLLSLAGSGKAFDPSSGTWIEAEALPTSPQALLPRAIERRDAGDGVVVERIAGADYKALGLCADECVLQHGQRITPVPPHVTRAAHPDEIVLRVDTEGEALVGDRLIRATDGPVVLLRRGAAPPTVVARAGRCHLLVAYAGPKRG